MTRTALSMSGRETKIFDPRDPSTGTRGAELLDPSVVQRGNQWWLYVAGQEHQVGAPELFSASLPVGAPLSATGWTLTRTAGGELARVAGRSRSSAWDGEGGRHCPSYVKGRDPRTGDWVERIYYAGGAGHIGGPYAIGYVEWDGDQWVDQPQPVFRAEEEWEHGSVYEPNLIWHDGKWKLWYVAGANRDNYLVHGFAESDDGVNWGPHTVFAQPEMKLFDFCVRQRGESFDAIYSRVWVGGGATPPDTGLWWCRAGRPSGVLSDWGAPVQIMTSDDRGWHSGPFKPAFQFSGDERAFVFFSGAYRTDDPGPFPFAFTLGCIEIDLPRERSNA